MDPPGAEPPWIPRSSVAPLVWRALFDPPLACPPQRNLRVKLYEYQGRQVFERLGIPTPKGVVVGSMEELEKVRHELTYPLVVKAQVLVGGRGKAGGIQFAS